MDSEGIHWWHGWHRVYHDGWIGISSTDSAAMRLIAFLSPVRPGRPGHPGDLERQVVAENRWNQTLLDLFTDRKTETYRNHWKTFDSYRAGFFRCHQHSSWFSPPGGWPGRLRSGVAIRRGPKIPWISGCFVGFMVSCTTGWVKTQRVTWLWKPK